MRRGRKWFDGKAEDLTLTKLETAWALGCSDAEAAAYADISTASLSRYLTAHPEIAERKERLKERPVLAARHTLVEAITGNPSKNIPANADLAMKYLERKRRNEFATRTEVAGTSEIVVKTEADKKALEDAE